MDNQDKEMLKGRVKKAMQTTFIFPIAVTEDLFGHLWGLYERDPSLITAQHREWKRLFDMYRKEVLDNGNNQLRQVLEDIDNHF